ncbi:ecto-ADP-ribosyltransferase 5 isoform X3 [Apodemus sylvaticus]|uniref:ecto-ADP-ribosyltransferase 5 isoform X3 n=1 Tax=Apodemus sylvaticus TaxID=10129 RepID=UPI0022425D68|nr:ecto-ADP-ribosyltransferase 5 isoform X3 [Apodemus sylvaticus]
MILEDLLMVLSCLGLHALWKVQAVPILPLSLVPDTFDDAYVGCSEEMEEKAGLLLKEEMARHALLRESWEAAQEAWAHRRHKLTLPPGFKAQHGVAVMVYTNSSNTLYWELNQAVRTGGGSREVYMRHFPFKALHFYLTRALQLLRGPGGGEETWLCVLKSSRAARGILLRGSAIREDAALGPRRAAALQNWTLKAP